MKFNVNKVLHEAEIERQKPKPLPKVRIKSKSTIGNHEVVIPSPGAAKRQAVSEPTEPISIDQEMIDSGKVYVEEQVLLHQLEREYADIRMERNKLSSLISTMVEEGATQEQLREHYEKIEAFRIPLQQHYDKIKYVKQHGALPEIKSDAKSEETLFELKDKKRKLIDKRCKLQKKLVASAKPSKPEQIANWELELEQATAEYNDVEKRIKQMEGRV